MSRKRQRKRCRYCHKIFHPDPRVGNRQKSCGQPACRKARKKQAQKEWVEKNLDYFKGRYENTRQWLKGHPGYLQCYRKSHPSYVQIHRDKQKDRRAKKSGRDSSQKSCIDIQDTIIAQPIGNIEDSSNLVAVDIQDTIRSQVVVPVYVSNTLSVIDIQDEIGRGQIVRYTPIRVITRKRLKQMMGEYQHAGG